MKNQPTFTISGVKEIKEAFRQLEPKIAKKVVTKAIRKGMKPIQAKVRELAPKRSGRLASRVKIRAMRRKRGRIGLNIIIGKGDFQGETYYAAMVELGSKKQKAQHYMQRAFEESKGEALATTSTEILVGIDREVKASQKT